VPRPRSTARRDRPLAAVRFGGGGRGGRRRRGGAALLEGNARHHALDERQQPRVSFHLHQNSIDRRTVEIFDPPPEGVREEFLGQTAVKIGPPRPRDHGCKFLRVGERLAGDQPAGGVERRGRLVGPPPPQGVISLEGKAERIHASVARRAKGVAAMPFHQLPHRRVCAQRGLGLFERRHIGRRGRGRGAQQVVENEQPPLDRRGPRRVARHDEEAALGQQPAPRQVVRQIDQPHLAARHVGNPVKLRQRLVEKRPPGQEQVGGRQALAEHVAEEQFGLLPHRPPHVGREDPLTHVAISDAEQLANVERQRLDVPRLEPLADEVPHEGVAPPVLDHPLDLLRQLRPEVGGPRELEELLVGHRAPEEVREPRRQRELVDRNGPAGVPMRRSTGRFHSKQKPR
jgi:hypothetical protein